MNTMKILFALFALISLSLTLVHCTKDKTAKLTDKELYEKSKSSVGFTYYKFNSELLPKSSGSGHSQAFLKTRFNDIAATVLDNDGKVLEGTSFPEGSLIVKELWSTETEFSRYAILLKEPGNPDADAKGWVWGYINADGSVAIPASDKGAACISCHSQSDNIDYTLMNKAFP